MKGIRSLIPCRSNRAVCFFSKPHSRSIFTSSTLALRKVETTFIRHSLWAPLTGWSMHYVLFLTLLFLNCAAACISSALLTPCGLSRCLVWGRVPLDTEQKSIPGEFSSISLGNLFTLWVTLMPLDLRHRRTYSFAGLLDWLELSVSVLSQIVKGL